MGLANAVLNAGQKTAGAVACVGMNSDGSIADTPAKIAAFQSSVSGAAITDTQAQASTVQGAVIGEIRTIADGPNKGARVRWYVPSGSMAPAWCWDIYPQSKYQG